MMVTVASNCYVSKQQLFYTEHRPTVAQSCRAIPILLVCYHAVAANVSRSRNDSTQGHCLMKDGRGTTVDWPARNEHATSTMNASI